MAFSIFHKATPFLYNYHRGSIDILKLVGDMKKGVQLG